MRAEAAFIRDPIDRPIEVISLTGSDRSCIADLVEQYGDLPARRLRVSHLNVHAACYWLMVFSTRSYPRSRWMPSGLVRPVLVYQDVSASGCGPTTPTRPLP